MFRFKQFTIYQDRTPMKVGTDGVLLGAWADLENAKTILDIGTGTGIIALMGAQRNPKAQIDALEIEPQAYEQALENIQKSPWPQHIHIFPIALQDYFPAILYDSIICNPPFFIDSTPASDSGRTLARHCATLLHTELAKHVARLLKPTGSFYVILPVIEAEKMLIYAAHNNLYPARITRVIPTPGKIPKRYLMKFQPTQTKIIEDELIIELSRHHYSEAYQKLTQAFYLYL